MIGMVLSGLAALVVIVPIPGHSSGGGEQSFELKNFRLEKGAVPPEAVVKYATYGKLNATHDNVVLLLSHYMADSKGYDWLIGTDKAPSPNGIFW